MHRFALLYRRASACCGEPCPVGIESTLIADRVLIFTLPSRCVPHAVPIAAGRRSLLNASVQRMFVNNVSLCIV